MNNEIKKTYEDARIAYERASVERDKTVMAARAECQAKIAAADIVVNKFYIIHNVAKNAYAQEVAKQ